MIPILLNALLLQAPVAIAPVNVRDEEVVWTLDLERRFWSNTVRRAGRSPVMQGFVERYGIGNVCNAIDNLRGRLVARHFYLSRDPAVRLARQQVPPGRLYEAVQAGPREASAKIGEADFDALMTRIDETGAHGTLLAADELQARMRSDYNEYVERWGGPRGVGDRPNEQGMARLRNTPDLLLTWCVASPQSRERFVGGYAKEER